MSEASSFTCSRLSSASRQASLAFLQASSAFRQLSTAFLQAVSAFLQTFSAFRIRSVDLSAAACSGGACGETRSSMATSSWPIRPTVVLLQGWHTAPKKPRNIDAKHSSQHAPWCRSRSLLRAHSTSLPSSCGGPRGCCWEALGHCSSGPRTLWPQARCVTMI